jgi:hypothetical protein
MRMKAQSKQLRRIVCAENIPHSFFKVLRRTSYELCRKSANEILKLTRKTRENEKAQNCLWSILFNRLITTAMRIGENGTTRINKKVVGE